jgi:glycosyltransferase involved in cell wall biosynthesis
MRVAFIYTAPHFSGAAVSLGEFLRAAGERVQATIFLPRGSAAQFFANLSNVNICTAPWLSQFDHTRFGRYRGLRWLIAARELVLLPSSWLSVRRFARQNPSIELIHLNEITGILPAVFLKRWLKVPLVVHVRAHLGDQSKGFRSRWLWSLADRYVDAIICIDETVRKTLPPSYRESAHVIHNGLGISGNSQGDTQGSFQRLPQWDGKTLVAIVGSLLPVKGIYEFTEAAIRIAKSRGDAVFVFVGGSIRSLSGMRKLLFEHLGLAEDAEQKIRARVAAHGLSESIIFVGHQNDLASVYRAIDLLCFPSHYNAPGRPIFEAAYFGKPSIVAIDEPLPDTLVHDETGLAIPGHDVGALTQAIVTLLDDAPKRQLMGQAAQKLAARNFDVCANADQLFAIYQSLSLRSLRRAGLDIPDAKSAIL